MQGFFQMEMFPRENILKLFVTEACSGHSMRNHVLSFSLRYHYNKLLNSQKALVGAYYYVPMLSHTFLANVYLLI